ncbi:MULTISPECIES: hypothetical protein [Psychrobacter]|uniref:Uncharacterized protein n=1 Tax=Psychrobacter alimentarius TaxID=261164 RepID=A0ABM6A1R0_9GAMM|nr:MULTISPECIES: hypothetical protein [Psychrobacter]AMT98269.1 hypothetical protein A3K91_2702 [Psychrobacter alimentarius]QCB31946.1 hypothetical protein E5677_13635 [Psychrobacter sp. PAMC27889]
MNNILTLCSSFMRSSKIGITMSAMLTVGTLATPVAHSAWFENLVPQGETYTVREIDRDLAFVIDGFIYDARTSCFLSVGDRVVFFEGRHGIDYRATIYDLDSRERCEVLLRRRLS